ncbi:MAG: Dam family site-specific DNA-(adenine-N6)-methyltransferase [Clostridia bacterium]|nr:Dam family site-specific DNA-(adenine-N6)-methyltransferase [Clostridia bacterium]
MPIIEPFVRWAGGKTWFIPHFVDLISSIDFNHFHEPFLGGAAVYLSLEHKKKSYLSDINEELINAYSQIRDNPYQVIKILLSYENTEADYYRIRSLNLDDPIEQAARFIFLNQTSYNGLYRVNRSGDYNVPYGHRKNWHYDEKRILQVSEKLQKTSIKCGDFECNKYIIKKHDLVFLDPPYTVSHNNNGFIEYNKNLFSLSDQERLCRFIEYIKRKDAYYILTNAAHPKIKEIFGKEEQPIVYSRKSLIGGKNSKREKIDEYIFTNIRREDKNGKNDLG